MTSLRDPGLSLLEAAEQAVAGFHACTTLGDHDVESIEVVWVSHGVPPEHEPVPGIRLTWRQGAHSFGLLISITRLADEAGDLAAVPFYLRLACDEPHGPTPDGSRWWFFDLPSGPYDRDDAPA